MGASQQALIAVSTGAGSVGSDADIYLVEQYMADQLGITLL